MSDLVKTVRLAPEPSHDPMAQQPGETAEAFVARLQSMITAKRAEVAASRVSSGKLGENIASKLNGQVLTLTIDLSKTLHKSASGKSTIVATTGGNVDVGNGLYIGVNCYRK